MLTKKEKRVSDGGSQAPVYVGIPMHIMGGKWRAIILYHLAQDKLRFNELRRLIPGITQRMLTLQLRELEKNGVIEREIGQDSPLRIYYRMTDLGRTLVPLIRSLQSWGEKYRTQFRS
ncbi:winged helix-turn-helix transcriptional regulator [Cohnella thermotolerans]|uniref:winged helix-turn-helix transcriptional regulator n=1 Tax=Cohnella thermotolerans TaxID=329858 RepID=UPI00041CE375|nr:helix-turn-helix domain-containing protein [Cohnella thermotolerans]